MMQLSSKLKKGVALPLLALFLAALLLGVLGVPAHAGDVAGIGTRLYLTVTGDTDGDAVFYVTYTDALGTHTKTYYPGMEVTAWSTVTITSANHNAEHWTLDVDVQEATISGVGGTTTHGDVWTVTGTNSVQVFATNFGLNYINVHVALDEDDGGSGDNGGGSGDNGGGSGDNGGGSGDNGGGSGDNGGGSGDNGGGSGDNGGGSGDNGGNDPSGDNGDNGNNGDNGDNDSNGNKTPNGEDSGSKTTATSPKTGDTRAVGALIALALLCAVIFAATYIRRRKHGDG